MYFSHGVTASWSQHDGHSSQHDTYTSLICLHLAVFIMVPVGIVRALSTTPIILDEDDDEDADVLADQVAATRGEGSKGEAKGVLV
jgi:hypothetical protein